MGLRDRHDDALTPESGCRKAIDMDRAEYASDDFAASNRAAAEWNESA